jgi:hypothetical protein
MVARLRKFPKAKPMTKQRLLRARSVLTKEWRDKFKHPAYSSVSHRLYSDDGEYYLARTDDLLNPNGVSLYKARKR